MSTTLVAEITSSASPQEGQKHRSSNNFAIPYVPEGTTSFTFKVIPSGSDNANSILFNVESDNPSGKDPIIWGGSDKESMVKNNYITSQYIKTFTDTLYIADPEGATSGFNVQIWANK